MDPTFSIHQGLWHDCWVAATSTSRSRKNQVDFNLQQRVARLLEDFGPQSERPLTLRVYGTMLKGFCVINNERARLLHTDCERVVLLFAQKPFANDGQALKLPANKRQRVDALTLDLDLAKVREAEAFDWSQASLEQVALLQINATPEEAARVDAPLVELRSLLDESFPGLDAPTAVSVDAGAAETARAAAETVAPAKAEGSCAAVSAPSGNTHAALPMYEELQLASLEDVGGADFGPRAPEEITLAQAPRRRGAPRGVPRQPAAGTVFGFDQHTVLPHVEFEIWQRDAGDLTQRPSSLEAYVAFLPMQDMRMDRYAPLRSILDGWALAPPDVAETLSRPTTVEAAQAAPVPEVQSLLGGAPEASTAERVGSVSTLALALPNAPSQQPLEQGIAQELSAIFGRTALDCEDVANAQGNEDAVCDLQTEQVGALVRGFLASAAKASQNVVEFADLIPPAATDKATAARSFGAVLALATAGRLTVNQTQPYGSITLSLS